MTATGQFLAGVPAWLASDKRAAPASSRRLGKLLESGRPGESGGSRGRPASPSVPQGDPPLTPSAVYGHFTPRTLSGRLSASITPSGHMVAFRCASTLQHTRPGPSVGSQEMPCLLRFLPHSFPLLVRDDVLIPYREAARECCGFNSGNLRQAPVLFAVHKGPHPA